MRLEHLCRITMQYTGDSSWHQPYTRPEGSSEQEFGYGTGDGTVTGELLNGTLTWVNTPERREDGVWMPNLRGFIKAADGGELLLSFTGLSIDGDSPERRRSIVGHVGLIALDCDTLIVGGDDLRIMVYTAEPGTEDSERLALAIVLGTQALVGRGTGE